MKKLSIVFESLVILLATAWLCYAQSNSSGVTTWTSQSTFVSQTQAQLNSLQAQINALAPGLDIPQGGPLTANLNAGSYKLTSLGAGTTNGDSVAFGQSSTQLNGLNLLGGALTGVGAIAASINNSLNAQVLGAACSSTTETATTIATNSSVSLGAAGDFAQGQYIQIDHAGATATAVTPNAPTVVTRSANQNDNVNFNGVNGYTGCATDGGNANCTTHYTYQTACVDSGGGVSAATSTTTVTTGPATLSITHDNDLQWATNSACISYAIYGCAGTSCSPKLEAVIPNLQFSNSGNGFGYGRSNVEWIDTGLYFGRDDTTSGLGSAGTGTPPVSAIPQNLTTKLTNVSGTTVTVATPPAQNGSFTIRHDDGPSINAGIALLPTSTTAGGTIQMPICANGSPYNVSTPISLLNTAGIRITGQAGDGYLTIGGAVIVYRGPAGGSVFNMNGTLGDEIDHIAIPADAGTTPGIGFDIDKYGSASNATASDYLHDDEVGAAGVCVNVGGRGTANNQNILLHNINCDQGGDFSHYGFIGILNGNTQAFGTVLSAGSVVSKVFGVLAEGGTMWVNDGVLFQDSITGWFSYGDGILVFNGDELESQASSQPSVLDGSASGNQIVFTNNHIYPNPGYDDFIDYKGDQFSNNQIKELSANLDGTDALYSGWNNSKTPVWMNNTLALSTAGTINPFARITNKIPPAIALNNTSIAYNTVVSYYCGNSITLSGSAGTFDAQCVLQEPYCTAVDTTNNANTCNVTSVINGVVTLHGSAASDVCLVDCRFLH